ncbi:MAG: MFS transporter [Pseudonocardiaceae bacterium]|nr:MFS transporter [Pseudonocardiaceae bacterium]
MTATAGERKQQTRRALIGSMVGTSLEWYDFFLYSYAAALIFGKLFFPEFDPLVGTLLAFGTYGVGYFARPLGGLVCGHFGDRVGRRQMLFITLSLMGAASVAIGLLPTYGTIGVAAPILLVGLRFLQGLAIGGELGGAILMAVERGGRRRRGLRGSVVQLGVPIGNLMATGVVAATTAVLSDQQFETWGWRVPFLLSALVVAVGLYIRVKVDESPEFADAKTRTDVVSQPLLRIIRMHKREALVSIGARLGADITFLLFAVFSLTYVSTQLGMPQDIAINAVLVASATLVLTIPLFGHVSDIIGRRRMYIAGILFSAIWAFVYFPLIDSQSPVAVVFGTTVGLVGYSMMYAPQAAFMAELFETGVRYSGVSIGTQVAGIFGASAFPAIAVGLLNETGSAFPVLVYVVAMLTICLVALLLAPQRVYAGPVDGTARPRGQPGDAGEFAEDA